MSLTRYEAPHGFALAGVVETHPYGATLLVERAGARFVAKRLSPRAALEPDARAQLAREGAVLRALDGRGAPRLATAGEDARGPFLVMDVVPFPPLAAAIGRGDAAWATRACGAAFGALAAVHDAADARGPLRVVHGDLGPSNVLVQHDGSAAALVDFGLARFRDGAPTPAGVARGTFTHAAPEVARSEPFDLRADLFALAATLLHVASGEPPRTLGGPALLVEAGETDLTPWARRAARAFPPELGRALVACVAFDAAARPASARDVLR